MSRTIHMRGNENAVYGSIRRRWHYFEQTYGPIWDHVAMTLSGLSLEQIAELGGYRVFDLETETVVHDYAPAEMVG